jgi:hypothetical protein
MAVLTRELSRAENDEDSWQIVYDTEVRQIFVERKFNKGMERFSINDFLSQSRGADMQRELEYLILDMFPNTEDNGA